MKVTLIYESAVYFAWFAGMGLVYLWVNFFPQLWTSFNRPTYKKPVRELVCAILVCAVLIGLSVLSYQKNNFYNSITTNKNLIYLLKIIVIYSPVFIYLLLTKQELCTCFLNVSKVGYKVFIGVFAALVAGYIFISINGNSNYSSYLRYIADNAFSVGRIQTFMEGMAVGFLAYRLFALLSKHTAAIIIAIVFMLSHIQSYSQSMGFGITETFILITAHTGITYIILLFVYKTQDMFSIFFLHWFINAASDFISQ